MFGCSQGMHELCAMVLVWVVMSGQGQSRILPVCLQRSCEVPVVRARAVILEHWQVCRVMIAFDDD